MQTLRQALEPVVDRVLETDGGDGEAGSGDGDTGRRGWGWGGGGGRKGEVFQCQEFANTMAQGRAVDMARCNFLLCVFVCARASLTHSYGQIEDNLWMSYIKKTKQNDAELLHVTPLPTKPLKKVTQRQV